MPLLRLQTTAGAATTVDLPATGTIASLKEALAAQKEEWRPASRLRIICHGAVLKDPELLSERVVPFLSANAERFLVLVAKALPAPPPTTQEWAAPIAKAVAHVETRGAFDALLAEAAAAGRAVVVDFTATWCGPCKQIAPIFEQLAREFPQATLVKVDVDANQETAQFCQISAMPTFKVFRDRKEVGMIRGANPAALKELIAKHAGDKFVGAGQTLGGGEGTAAAESSAPAMTEREKRLAALERRGL